VREVGGKLPASRRSDVEAEIRTLLEDELAARPVADEAAALEILQAFGQPSQVAMRYGATQYLIGPMLYPIFVTVLRVVLVVTLGISFFALAISIGLDGAPWNPFDALGSIFAGLVQAGAVVVIVFALIERLQKSEERNRTSSWDPRTLAAVRDEDRAKTGELIATITFTIIALLVFNFYLDDLGRYWTNTSGWQSTPVFDPHFAVFVPWLSVWWLGDLLLAIVVLARGRWTLATRISEIALNCFGLVILLQMLLDGPLAAFPPLEPVFKLVIGILFAVTALETVRSTYRLFTARRGDAHATPTLTSAH
jgi:hypothetical protein